MFNSAEEDFSSDDSVIYPSFQIATNRGERRISDDEPCTSKKAKLALQESSHLSTEPNNNIKNPFNKQSNLLFEKYFKIISTVSRK